jgi:mRNA interferase RelE/StbE
VSRYTVYLTPAALREIRNLPGNMRQRVKRTIDALADDPRPAHGKALNLSEDFGHEVWRIRLDKWRVVYAVTEADEAIDVLAVRKRPPYDYGDLRSLLAGKR